MPPTPDQIRDRFETDASDDTLSALIEEAVEEIEDRYGPYRDPDSPLVVLLPSRGRRRLDIPRPIDTSQPIQITEWLVADWEDVMFADAYEDSWVDVGETEHVLDDTDYRVWNRGRTLERLYTGAWPRVFWGSRVQVTYQPVDDTAKRDEVAVKLVILALQYQGSVSQRAGDVQTQFSSTRASTPGQSPLLYSDERDALLRRLAPRRGMLLR